MTDPTPYTPPDGRMVIKTSEALSPPDGWEWTDTYLAEIRPARLRDPEFMLNGTWADANGRQTGITVVAEMRGRADLDQWEYADTEGYWGVMGRTTDGWWDNIAARDPAFPIVVRRKAGGS